MDFWESDELATNRDAARAWADANVRPEWAGEQRRTGCHQTMELHARLARDGILGAGWPAEYGGSDVDPGFARAVFDELARRGLPSDRWSTTMMVACTIQHVAAEEQKRQYLPAALRGEMLIALGYTEPDTGSDVASAKTTAVRAGADWVISGQKMFTSTAQLASHVFVLARTSPDGPKHQGLTLFLVPAASAGYVVKPIRTLGGQVTRPSGGCPGLQAGRNPVPRAPGQEKTAARTAWLPRFFDQTCDPAKVRMAYRCRAYPDQQQQTVLNRTFGCVRVVWNRTLAARHVRYAAEGTGTSYAETDRALTAMKKDPGLAFLTEVSSVPLQQALRHQHQAFRAFFARRARYPRFKSRRSRQSAHYTRSAFSLRGGQLRLAKMAAPVRFVWSWPEVDVAALDPAMVIVSRESDGRWYVTFTLDASDPEPLPQTGRAVGIDLGVADFAVTSAGETIANPRHLERKARSLTRYQRRMARCQQGSANRARAAAKVARAHRKVRHARADFLHRVSTRLVRQNDVIVIEDLNVAGLVRNRHLARAISGCGWGEFRRQLAYKCARYGRRLVVIDRWYPSSKTCSGCGHRLAELSLSARRWRCPSCGARHDRDVNAAKNILAAGRAVARGFPGDACGAEVRHSGSSRVRSAAKQEPRPARAGIPALQGGE